MIRHTIAPRADWKAKVESIGFSFHTLDQVTYWDERAYYSFTSEEVATLEKASAELYACCLAAVEHVVRYGLYDLFCIPDRFKNAVEQSWRQRDPSVYGRFDLAWNGTGAPKMLEFNADTPTSLFEAGAVQWFWLNDVFPEADQFNSIHEKLIQRWKELSPQFNGPVYFSCLHQFPEDVANVQYLRDCAQQAGLSTEFIPVADIGVAQQQFVDLAGNPIRHVFKLYPWEWMVREEFAPMLLTSATQWMEPNWKMLLSNKALMAVLWQLFPGHPNLLECYFDHAHTMTSYARKPLLSREGANVLLVDQDRRISETSGEYGEEGFIYQQLYKLPDYEGNHPVIGSWIIGDKPAGIGIRESTSLVTDNFSRFLPHLIR